MCHFDGGGSIFKGEEQAYQDAYELVKELEDNDELLKRIEMLEQENEQLKEKNKILEMNVNNTYETGQEIIYELEQEIKNLKKIIKANFGYSKLWNDVYFNYNAPVMENEIIKVLKNE